jgi:CRP/FNR family transcriptional regulator, anaerobic regulatory protein
LSADATTAKTTIARQVPCEQCPLRALNIFRNFSSEELAFVSQFKAGELSAEAGTTILLEGTNSPHLYTLLSGWAFRHKFFDGGRRQILNFALPGDLLGLQGSVMDAMQHSVEVLTDWILCVFPRDKLWALYTQFPSLAFDVTWLAAREEQMRDEHLLSVGQRDAFERIAFVLLQLYARAEALGLAKRNKIQFPLTQQHLADSSGMSLVHTNKTLRRLTNRGVISWKDKTFEILDRNELAKIAKFHFNDVHPRPFI